MTLEEFSGGYYSLDMYVQEYSDGPVIEEGLYDLINREVYSRTTAPITMKLSLDNGTYFNVDAERSVPTDVLAIPEEWVDNLDVEKDGRKRRVFVLKPGRAYTMMNDSVEFEE